MRYCYQLSVPVGTTAADPTTWEITLTPGVIERASFYFPPGSGGYLNVQLWLNGSQLIPWERGEWLRGDDVLIPDSGRYPVDEEPYLLTIKAYNDGTLYAHQVLVAVELTAYQIVTGGGGEMSVVGMRYE